VWKILIFERILLIEIQTNCKNWVWKENLVEPSMCSYLGANGIGYTSPYMKQNSLLLFYLLGFASTGTRTVAFDPTFVTFTLLKPVSH
jgi:hypothetical protein